MAITQRDYKPGIFEAFSGVNLGNPTIGVSAYFVLDGYWKFDVADVVLRADSAAGPILAAGVDYTLLEDEKYTELEANHTGKTLYAKYTVVNPAFTGRPIFAEGNNFGSMISNEDTKRYIDDSGVTGEVDFRDYNPSLGAPPTVVEGRTFYEPNEKTIRVYNDLLVRMELGRTLSSRFEALEPISKGQVVYVSDFVSPGVLGVKLATANSYNQNWVLGVAANTANTGGIVEFMQKGVVEGVDTSGLDTGVPLYICDIPGALVDARPEFPCKPYVIGAVVVSDVSAGVLGVNIQVDPYQVEFDGCTVEKHDISLRLGVGAEAGKVFADVEKDGGGDLPIQLQNSTVLLDCTTGGAPDGKATVEMTPGTVDSRNYYIVYADLTGGNAVLRATTTYPPQPFVWLGVYSLADLSFTTNNGAIVSRQITTAQSHDGRGRISYIMERSSVEPPLWKGSGCTPTATIITAPSPDLLDLTSIAGSVYQNHRQTWPGLTVSTDGVYVINGPGGAGLANLTKLTNLTLACGYTNTDEPRNTNCRGHLNIIGFINEEAAECKLGVALPNALYNGSDSDAYLDYNNTATNSVDVDLSYTAFNIAQVPYDISAGGETVTFINPAGSPQIINKLGIPLGITGGAAGGSGSFIPTLLQVLTQGNSAGNLQIKDLQDGTLPGDAINKGQLDLHTNSTDRPHGEPLLSSTYSSHSFTIAPEDKFALVNTATETVNAVLPLASSSPSGVAKTLVIKNAINDGSDLVISPQGGDALFPINAASGGGVASITIPASQSMTLLSWSEAVWFAVSDTSALATLGDYLKRNGSLPMTGNLNLDSNKITNLGNATADTDALNRITADGRYVNKITSTDNAIARYDGTAGEVQNSTFTITDAGDMDAGGGDVVNVANVGINYNSPERPLHVNGKVALSDFGASGFRWELAGNGAFAIGHYSSGVVTTDTVFSVLGIQTLPQATTTNIDAAGNKAVPTVEWVNSNAVRSCTLTGTNIDAYFTPSRCQITTATGTLPTAETTGWLDVYYESSVSTRQVWRPKSTDQTYERYYNGTVWSTWALISRAPWQDAASTSFFNAAWENQDATNMPLSYRREGGFVHLVGSVKPSASAVSSSTTIGQLPAGFRPRTVSGGTIGINTVDTMCSATITGVSGKRSTTLGVTGSGFVFMDRLAPDFGADVTNVTVLKINVTFLAD